MASIDNRAPPRKAAADARVDTAAIDRGLDGRKFTCPGWVIFAMPFFVDLEKNQPEGPICFVGALARALNVERLRLAPGLSSLAPP